VDVREAVLGRSSVRAFLDRPVERTLLEDLLEVASRAPSGGNLQPWRLFVLTGTPLEKLKACVADRIDAGEGPDVPEYAVYPPKLWSPYRERRYRNGEQLYAALEIPRENRDARLTQFARNFQFFGAPVGLFCYIDRKMGAPQWADLGMYLQSLMLLLHAEGLATCPQEAWSSYHRLVAEIVEPPAEMMLFCGMAIGYPDPEHKVNIWRSERAPVAEIADFRGWD
jgi:nitroreductase